jgi:hypothetical protein
MSESGEERRHGRSTQSISRPCLGSLTLCLLFHIPLLSSTTHMTIIIATLSNFFFAKNKAEIFCLYFCCEMKNGRKREERSSTQARFYKAVCKANSFEIISQLRDFNLFANSIFFFHQKLVCVCV